MTEAYDGRQVVGMDLHRRRSVLVRMTEDGRKLETVRIANSPAALRAVIARAGDKPRVVVEAACGWYWAADVLEAAGAEVHLAHPLGVKAFTYRRVKNERDCIDLADLLRLGKLPEAWIAPPPVRELREVTRYRTSWWASGPAARTRCTRCWPRPASRSPGPISSAPAAGSGWTGCRCRSPTPARPPRCAR
jgi:Transposase